MARTKPLPTSLLDRPFTRADAQAADVTDSMLRSSRFTRVFRGVYIPTGLPLTLVRHIECGRLIAPPGSLVSHRTAMQLYGIALGPRLPLEFSTDRPHAVDSAGLVLHRRMTLPSSENGVVTVEMCWIEMCLTYDLVRAVAVADRLIHLGRTTRERLVSVVDSTTNWEGIKAARAAVSYVRAKAESPRESEVRMMLVLAGLPCPRCNVDVVDGGVFLGRGDLVYIAYRVIIEYDGRQHAEDVYQWNRELDRLDGFGDHQWSVIRVTDRRLRQPRVIVTRVYERLVANGYRGPAPEFSPEWCALFERRPRPA